MKGNHMVEGTSGKDLSQWVADTLGRVPGDISLYEEAMRHRSYAHAKGLVSNGRLAYLGDAILKSILSELLYCQVPAMDEGRMSTLRSEVENGKKLSYWADKLALPICTTTPVMPTVNMKEEAMEALIGAFYLDSGWVSCKAFISHFVKSEGFI